MPRKVRSMRPRRVSGERHWIPVVAVAIGLLSSVAISRLTAAIQDQNANAPVARLVTAPR